MALNFPLAPSIGQLYPSPPVAGQPVYQWDGEKWTVLTGGTSPVYVGDLPPNNPPNGALWWNSSNGQLYINYNDGNSSQWVMIISALNTSPLAANRYITGNDTLTPADHGKNIVFVSPTALTLTASSVAALGDGWYCDIFNANVGIVTFDPNGSDTVDGFATASIWGQERMRLVCNGVNGFSTYNHSGDWVSYTPTLVATGGGAPSGPTAGRFKKVRTTVQIGVQIGPLAGTGINFLQFSLPVIQAPNNFCCFAVQETAVNGKTLSAYSAGAANQAMLRYADGTASASTLGAVYYSNGMYECNK